MTRVVLLADHSHGSKVLAQVLSEHCDLALVVLQSTGTRYYPSVDTDRFDAHHYARIDALKPDWRSADFPPSAIEVMSPWIGPWVEAMEEAKPDAFILSGARFVPLFIMQYFSRPWLALLPLGTRAEVLRLDTEEVLISSDCPVDNDDSLTMPWACWLRAMPLLLHSLERLARHPSEHLEIMNRPSIEGGRKR